MLPLPEPAAGCDAAATARAQRCRYRRAPVDGADVAERAAARCEQQIDEIESMIRDLEPLERQRKFGDNADGRAAATAFRDAAVTGENSVRGVLVKSQEVLRNMAATYRAAGGAAAQAEQANQQMFSGGAE